MKTTDYLNSPVKSCKNCAYCDKEVLGIDTCTKYGFLCSTMRKMATDKFSLCDEDFSGWRQRPKRRSLRRWLADLLWS